MVIPRPVFLDALELLVGRRALSLEQHPVAEEVGLHRERHEIQDVGEFTQPSLHHFSNDCTVNN